ncbi:hypothetical protein RJ640_008140 [Escallonia rubra]|uniref:Uncharacterized protein n=1 Tax=Escallonia rubra TaxID=112253 RepID=A0AA88RAS8_9ASTE|nr:hypothetical protein RJ640_008140 [Escallonia rubra]
MVPSSMGYDLCGCVVSEEEDYKSRRRLGPQQLRYMTVLRDSSARFAFSSLSLLATTADDEEESFLV